jgi:anti-sigma factor RsiW
MTSQMHLTEELAQRYLDDLLPEPVRASASAHLEGCADCQALLESHLALSEALSRLPRPQVPRGFTAEVMARVERRERKAAWERHLAAAILLVTTLGASLAMKGAGGSALAAGIAGWSEGLVSAATTLRIVAEVLPPVASVLRLPIFAACALGTLAAFMVARRLRPRLAKVTR